MPSGYWTGRSLGDGAPLLFSGPKQRIVDVSLAVTLCKRKQANPERQPPLVHDLGEVNKGSGNLIFIPMLLKKVGKCNR